MADAAPLSLEEIDARSAAVDRALEQAVVDDTRLVIVKAPPGSGKTTLLLKGVRAGVAADQRIAVGAQTNSQANDICMRIARVFPEIPVARFAASGAAPVDLGATVAWVSDKHALPQGPCVVVSTVAKWSLTQLVGAPYDVMMVDESWQMAWADFMLCSQVSSQFVLIGDPGQIPPVVSINVQRWETAPRAPHQAAPELLLIDDEVEKLVLELPACRRLPRDSVDLVRPFYDFDFAASAQPGERWLRPGGIVGEEDTAGRTLGLLESGSAVAMVLRTPAGGPPLELDDEVARAAVSIVERALELGMEVVDSADGEPAELRPEDIGLVATHRVMNNAMYQALPAHLRGSVAVDTPERWQGLERKLMVAVHPLSGVLAPSSFDLETGRLCVMTSRHRAGLVVVARDHIPNTLETHIPAAEQAVGRPDVTGRGHEANLRFWERMERDGRVVRAV